MTDRPIPFKPEMVQALLDGRKTQTRRVLKPQPEPFVDGFVRVATCNKTGKAVWETRLNGKPCLGIDRGDFLDAHVKTARVGDRLWVKEAWRAAAWDDHLAPSELLTDHNRCWLLGYEADRKGDLFPGAGRLRAGMHMPRWASRLTLIVTDVKVERVQDISARDAVAEGIDPRPHECGCEVCARTSFYCPATASSIIMAFADLWNSINGKKAGCAWDDNPWVCATSFRCIAKNIDEVPDD